MSALVFPKARLSHQAVGFYSQLRGLGIETICTSGRCPNRGECFSQRQVSVLILGGVCTRNCGFCGVEKAVKGEDFQGEIERLRELIAKAGIRSLVITSVTRDDLPDGGAGHFCDVVNSLKQSFPYLKIELLIPDFGGREGDIEKVAHLEVELIGHNIETVPRLYPSVRPMASYERSLRVLELLASVRGPDKVKTAVMVGLGEDLRELESLFRDVRTTGCGLLCVGQYLPPREDSVPVKKYYSLGEFEKVYEMALKAGFSQVWVGPLVRSSLVGGMDEDMR